MKLLLVCGRYPWPARRGDQLRTVQWIDALTPEHEVVLLAPAGSHLDAPPPRRPGLEVELYRPAMPSRRASRAIASLLTGSSFQTGLFHSPDLAQQLRRRRGSQDGTILLLARLVDHLEDLAEPPLVDLVDSLSLNLRRRAAVDRRWRRPLLLLEARRLERVERRMVSASRRALVVADRDRRDLADRLPVDHRQRLHTVPIAVPAASTASQEKTADLTFTGNLGYFVNYDAITSWTRDVWPALTAARSGLRLVVAGDRPPRDLRRVLRHSGVQLVSSPADLRQHLAAAVVSLAPLRCGSGVPIKILEAWSAGTPVIASPWAAAGLDGTIGDELTIADRPIAWQHAVERLLDDPSARRDLAASGRRALARYLPERVEAELREQVRETFS